MRGPALLALALVSLTELDASEHLVAVPRAAPVAARDEPTTATTATGSASPSALLRAVGGATALCAIAVLAMIAIEGSLGDMLRSSVGILLLGAAAIPVLIAAPFPLFTSCFISVQRDVSTSSGVPSLLPSSTTMS